MASSPRPDGNDALCPACGSSRLHHFFHQPRVPVHATQLLSTPAEAAAYPMAEMRLAFCSQCAFITNMAYDAARLDYSGNHEESQSYSPRFRAFAQELARRWIEQYELRGKTALEIGCGKGDFLASMLEEGIHHAIGVDPGARPGRMTGPAAGRAEWVLENFTPVLGQREPDAIVCRHTLEHIHSVRAFLDDIRASIGSRPKTVVLFELPDALRILRETAFWDIYYEHCSYFTPGSLGRLFRASGFDIIDLSLGYDGQYLLLAARPRPFNRPPAPPLPIEEDVAAVAEAVSHFERGYARQMATWRQRLQDARDRGLRTVIWGGGAKGLSFLTALGDIDTVQYAVDVNPNLHGRYMAGIGRQVVPPAFLVQYRPHLVVVMNSVYTAEIRAMLGELGLSPTLVAL